MKAADLQKVVETLHGAVIDTIDHLAKRFENGAEKLGEDYLHLSEFSSSWSKASKSGRKLFVEQLLKSSALVIASTVATKAGLELAGRKQKQVRKLLLIAADFIQPMATKAMKKKKKVTKKAKKRLK